MKANIRSKSTQDVDFVKRKLLADHKCAKIFPRVRKLAKSFKLFQNNTIDILKADKSQKRKKLERFTNLRVILAHGHNRSSLKCETKLESCLLRMRCNKIGTKLEVAKVRVRVLKKHRYSVLFDSFYS